MTQNQFNRFDFGLPLEDISPENDIHPKLKKLFIDTYLIIINSYIPIDEIVRQSEGQLSQRLTLKEHILNSEDYLREHISPGTFIWLIRHFLLLLPLPVLPVYTNGQKYKWHSLTARCKYKLKTGESNHQIQMDISKNLSKLPKHNAILMDYLISLIRKICTRYFDKNYTVKEDAILLTKYFSSSLFIRPYKPGLTSKKDQNFHPLTYYIIAKWPNIYVNHENLYSNINIQKEIQNNFLRYEDHRKSNVSCQTDFNLNNSNIHYISVKKTQYCCQSGTNYIIRPSETYSYLCTHESFKSAEETNTIKLELNETDQFLYSIKEQESSVSLETNNTEGYVYDDYDTFQSEEYNQISNNSKERSINSGKLEKNLAINGRQSIKNDESSLKLTRKISQTNTSIAAMVSKVNSKLNLKAHLKKCKSGTYKVGKKLEKQISRIQFKKIKELNGKIQYKKLYTI